MMGTMTVQALCSDLRHLGVSQSQCPIKKTSRHSSWMHLSLSGGIDPSQAAQ